MTTASGRAAEPTEDGTSARTSWANRRRPLWAFLACCTGFLLWGGPALSEPIPADAVFAGALTTEAARIEFLKQNAGRRVEGEGYLETMTPRTYFDTSVPDSNQAIAMIQLQAGRKVTCGLSRPLQREALAEMREGARIVFAGELVDAQDWGEWQTLYLSSCELVLRPMDGGPETTK